MIILQPHWCPRCKVMREEWKVKGSKLNKKVRVGDPWPQLEPIRTEAVDKCSSCKMKLQGQVVVLINENGEPEKLSHVKEVNND